MRVVGPLMQGMFRAAQDLKADAGYVKDEAERLLGESQSARSALGSDHRVRLGDPMTMGEQRVNDARSIALTFPVLDRPGASVQVRAEGAVGNVWVKSMTLHFRDGHSERQIDVLSRGSRTTVDL